jgi:hypothetical protein
MGVQADGYFISDFGYDDEGSVEQSDDVFVFLLVAVLLDLLPHYVIE